MDSLETLVQDRVTPPPGDRDAESVAQPLAYPAAVVRARPGEGTLLHGRYRLLERLGAGGFGVVWRARDELLHREVALKRIPLPPERGASGEHGERHGELQAGERASREALACARLAHPAIVALYEAYVDDDAFYLVSELVAGDTLAALAAAGALTDETLLEIALALISALAHAHARGVVHRDVKPQNVLIPRDPPARAAPAKLTDFGGASLSGEDALTRTGETLGTLAYMAPEQSEGRETGEPADLYSLALVVYEGLTGVNPVRGPTPAATARRIGRQLPPLAARRPDLPHSLTHALDRALAADPSRRGTLAQLREAVEAALAGGLIAGRGPRASTPPVPTYASATLLPAAPAAHSRRITLPTPAAPAAHSRRIHEHSLADGSFAAHVPPGRVRGGDPREESPALPPRRGLPLPRALWLGCALALTVWQLASGRPGLALLVALALCAPLLLLGPRPGVGWLAAALAPLLGLIGLAGVYPALAGQASPWLRRAALGALGYWWLSLAGPLLAGGRASARLWLGPPAGTPPRAVWEGSLGSAAAHVIAPTLTTGLLCGAILWAGGAAVLPWVVRGSSALRDTLAAIAWSVALLAATPYFDAGLAAHAVLPRPRGDVLAAVLAAGAAIAAGALRGPVKLRHP